MPDERLLKVLEGVDVLIMNIDGSQHILSYEQIDSALQRIKPKVVVPGYYLAKGVSSTLTTLSTADEWVEKRGNYVKLTSGKAPIAVFVRRDAERSHPGHKLAFRRRRRSDSGRAQVCPAVRLPSSHHAADREATAPTRACGDPHATGDHRLGSVRGSETTDSRVR